MLFVCYKGCKIIGCTSKFPITGDKKKFVNAPEGTTSVKSRHDWKSYEEVCLIAKELSKVMGKLYVGITDGSTQFDVICCPAVGDEVSYSFNGDYHPDGKIVRLTKTLQVITSTGKRYRRRGLSGTWIQEGGTWSLVPGHISRQNPEF